jgi:hypothetical protein
LRTAERRTFPVTALIAASAGNAQSATVGHAVETITSTQVRVTFTVTFNDGSTAVGSVTPNHT